MRHGSASTYNNQRCRCAACRTAHAEYTRTRRRNRASRLVVPLSAIWALVQQWRDKAVVIDGNMTFVNHAFYECADQLAALCPAPPEDQA